MRMSSRTQGLISLHSACSSRASTRPESVVSDTFVRLSENGQSTGTFPDGREKIAAVTKTEHRATSARRREQLGCKRALLLEQIQILRENAALPITARA